MSWHFIGEVLWIFYFFFTWPAILLFVYWWVFREWPFPRGYKWSQDRKILAQALSAVREGLVNIGDNNSNVYYYSEEDYYDPGQISADERARIRHPKNANRAYSGGSERFHDG